jgi:sulfate adenylyltransferase
MTEVDPADHWRARARDFPSHALTDRQLADLELLTNGSFAPLTGYLGAADHASVIANAALADGTPWPRPVELDVPGATADAAVEAGHLGLRDAEGVLLAVLTVTERFRPDAAADAWARFGPVDASQPGVDLMVRLTQPERLAGPVALVEPPTHWDLVAHRGRPPEIRARATSGGNGAGLIGMVTAAPPTLGVLDQLRRTADNDPLLVLLAIGPSPSWALDRFALMRTWELATAGSGVTVAVTPLARTGDEERDSALAAHVLRAHGATEVVTVTAEDGSPVPPVLDGLRRALERGDPLPADGYPGAVEAELRRSYPPLSDRGLTVFMTGFSGSGKSTVAQALAARLREHGGRSVALLDGDRVRHHLSSELGFSRAHRDLNIRRIGFVAAEVTRAGGIAICAPIAPYDDVRRDVRAMVEEAGGFVLVHISTPLEVCEGRDRKGLYAKARAGEIAEFTGISDPYEVPTDAELTLDTTDLTVDEAVDRIVAHLVTTGHLTAD